MLFLDMLVYYVGAAIYQYTPELQDMEKKTSIR
jgi:hypothetical protein